MADFVEYTAPLTYYHIYDIVVRFAIWRKKVSVYIQIGQEVIPLKRFTALLVLTLAFLLAAPAPAQADTAPSAGDVCSSLDDHAVVVRDVRLGCRTFKVMPYVGPTFYVVKAGDTLWGIAARYAGGGKNWRNLCTDWRDDPRHLPVDTKVYFC